MKFDRNEVWQKWSLTEMKFDRNEVWQKWSLTEMKFDRNEVWQTQSSTEMKFNRPKVRQKWLRCRWSDQGCGTEYGNGGCHHRNLDACGRRQRVVKLITEEAVEIYAGDGRRKNFCQLLSIFWKAIFYYRRRPLNHLSVHAAKNLTRLTGQPRPSNP
jgi:hypothetical protein